MSFLIEELEFNPSQITNYDNGAISIYPNPNSGLLKLIIMLKMPH